MSNLAKGMKSVLNQDRQANDQSGDQSASQPTVQSPRRSSKSASPDYTRITVYIRRDTDNRLRQRLLTDGRREMSDLVQQLLEDYLGEGK